MPPRPSSIVERLARSEHRLRLALTAGRMGTWDWDIATSRTTWSATLERIHGLEPGTFSGTFEAFQSDILPEDRPRVLEAIEKTLETGSDYAIEYRIVRPDGETRWLEARGAVLMDEEGRPIGMSGVCSDVTERKAAESNLRLLADATATWGGSLDTSTVLRRVARLIVPRLADWCAVYLVDGDVAVSHVDPRKKTFVERWVRRRARGAAGSREIEAVLRTGRREVVREVTPAMLVEAAEDDAHLELLRSLQLHSYVCVPMEAAGRIIGAVACVFAESGRRYGDELPLIEAVVQRAAFGVDNARLFAQAHAAVSARDEVLATVSHDLRSPLQTIAAAVEVLAGGELDPGQRRALEALRRAQAQATTLLEDLLDAARMQAGKLTLDAGDADLAELLGELEALHQPGAAAKNQRLEVHPPNPPVTLQIDRNRVLQLLGNLVGNAIKYTPSEGKIVVDVRAVDAGVRICVSDDGPGIPPEVRDRLFEPFWQADPRGPGMGLGLSIVRALADAHGADLAVDSEPGRGTTFCVTFPRGRPVGT